MDSPLNTLTLDLLELQKILGLHAKPDLVSRVDGLRVLPMSIGEGLGNYDDARRKKQMHVLGARLADGTPLSFFQEPWESGFTIAFPGQIPKGKALTLELELDGDFMNWWEQNGSAPG